MTVGLLKVGYPVNIDVKSPHFVNKVIEESGDKGVDLILDSDVSSLNNLDALKVGGTVVTTRPRWAS
ncbi:hypothetical protein LIER_42269 [Lithospermum erythrorhizon]|uniref:Uncharacterized protein n=1 Tax=Lithospermum erythrorhizon TaxID=34254 RepID=A0AAV3RMR1_LITER